MRTWEAGLPRATPAGNPLSGVYKDNYWIARITDATYADQKLASALSNVLEELSPKKELLQNLAATGGTVELFVGWFFDEGNSGDVLGYQLMGKLAEFSVNLSFDVYPTAIVDS